MTREEIVSTMVTAFKSDRARLFVAISELLLQEKYAIYTDDLNDIKQEWVDMESLDNFPEMPHPAALPIWFPVENVVFTSSWGDGYVNEMLLEFSEEEEEPEDLGADMFEEVLNDEGVV